MAPCDPHACDCTAPIPHWDADGAEVMSSRPHVVAKLRAAAARHAAAEPRPEGAAVRGRDWAAALRSVIAGLTYAERAVTYGVPLGAPRRAGLPAPVDQLLRRGETGWFPDLMASTRLYPWFQPIVRLTDGTTYGREALIRGALDERVAGGREIVAAARAHDAGFVLDQRARTAALEYGIPRLPAGESLFINFNPSSIYDPDVCLRTTWAAARRFDFPLRRVCFEVVETEAFPEIGFLRRILDRYRDEGAMVALDDLGAGNTSLNYLRELRPDIVKLDRGLIRGLERDAARQHLVDALIAYAHDLGILVVAEGIESADELDMVRALGADLGQGWHLGAPEPEPQPVDPALVTRSGRSWGGHATRLRAGVLAPTSDGESPLDRALRGCATSVVMADALTPGFPTVYCNPAFERLTGYSEADVLGRPCSFLQGEDTDPATVAVIADALRDGREVSVRLVNYRKDGTPFHNELRISPVLDHAGRLVQYIGIQSDVSERVRDHQHTAFLALHDAVTGLPNRAQADQRLGVAAERCARGEDEAGIVLFGDLDDFKLVNDVFGHAAGDRLLAGVARRLERLLRPGDLLARYGGDEFLVLRADVHGDAEAEGLALSEDLQTALAEPVDCGEDWPLSVRMSIGLTILGPECTDVHQVFARADTAMYQAKRAGGGVRRYDRAWTRGPVAEAVTALGPPAAGPARRALVAPRRRPAD